MHFTNVIFNLLDNAVKYRRDDCPLQLTVATRSLPGDKIEISIADNGIGIKRDDLKKVFEKFGKPTTISPYRKSDTPSCLISSVADGPTARSFIAHGKSPHSSQKQSSTSPPVV